MPKVGASGNINIDIFSGIKDLAKMFNDQSVDRGEATQLIVDHFTRSFPDKNCIVCHSPHVKSLNGMEHDHIELPRKVGTIGYEIYVFDDGEFTNLGDGGYINWAFAGNFVRDPENDKIVHFFKRE
ncbi:unnamed protein product [Rotaria sp. Silwood2]|nr:unnamed protein product [Rotaria sp. Silwood2]CAF2997589.1 unnamed protein product [Rotaria sp. Silwood2]CAF3444617.1 unnamed protein product [Rotaria sp. Silwood2]CAF4095060.1 unnamed protein product [Rotaria sp. Silwood2]CAF4347302.1 unnamed protein product [Rotaria sp. Silwood2]